MTTRNQKLIEKLGDLPCGDDGNYTLSAETVSDIQQGLNDPVRPSRIALAKLREAHREEYDFYHDHAKNHYVGEWQDIPDIPLKLKVFSLADYLDAALACAEYEQDDDGMIIASVPSAAGCYSQGESHEEARTNLRDAVEGNVLMALQMGWEIPQIQCFEIRIEVVPADSA